MSVNQRQVGGDHYKAEYQHWDFVERNGLGYLEGCATKYVSRWRKKNGVQDLEKSLHYVEKLIEMHSDGERQPRGRASVEDVRRFVVANKLNPDEHLIILLLSGWAHVHELQTALAAIKKMLAEQVSPPADSDLIEYVGG